ncbi:hypothetical protein O6H91_14G081600 [Diphasiastrum complanatum]|uniref:Uncharacterized protein n=1 Tax=Diphasiastrum complanatum TaxID=34168 RepID=A0ACC2BRI1_DIPCM|nr:hypothetical protein O6H91_Y015500 [Diphasiastrum complanatum]KAJ7532298.1 hypothetical protein O6H91_14G081600 [Diphasiastrum complanatum]
MRIFSAAFPPSLPTMSTGFGGSDSDFPCLDKKFIVRATMIIVGILLIVLVCLVRWDSILSWFLSSVLPNADELQHQEMQGPEEKAAGLKDAVVSMIPVIQYDKKAIHSPHIEWKGLCSECMICLSDFRDGEMVRILPICGHLFHMECVDVWFNLHTSCPVCRHNIVQGAAISACACDEEITEHLPEQASVSVSFWP